MTDATLSLNRETLPDDLGAFQIAYTHIPELGGLRGKQRGANPSINIFWRVRSFQNYADYALTQQFHVGLSRLRVLGHQRRSVIICAEVCGGAVTGASLRTILLPQERASFTSLV